MVVTTGTRSLYVPCSYVLGPRHTIKVCHLILISVRYGLKLHSRPLSTGTLRLKSADPWTNPLMDPRYALHWAVLQTHSRALRYLEAPEDVQRIMRGLKLIFKIVRAEPLAAHLDHTDRNPLLDHSTHLKTDEELEKLIRERVETLYHPAGTCRMAPLEEGGVVDSRLRVHGIRGLRVCDASIFPEIVSGHTVHFRIWISC